MTATPEHSIRDIVLRLIVHDHAEVMYYFRGALDYIDEHMSDDNILRSCLQHWRYILGRWKRNLANDTTSIAHITQTLTYNSRFDSELASANDSVTEQSGRVNSNLCFSREADLDKLMKEVKSLTERVGSTFQSIISTMSLVESAKAITQAEEITKLTHLAFFFTPLTLCASIFGMNIQVSNRMRSHPE